MRPPEEIKKYWQPAEEYALKQLDEPGGMNTFSRRKRALLVVGATLLLLASGAGSLSLTGHDFTDWGFLIFFAVFMSPVFVYLVLLVVDPRKAVRWMHWGSPPPERPALESKAPNR